MLSDSLVVRECSNCAGIKHMSNHRPSLGSWSFTAWLSVSPVACSVRFVYNVNLSSLISFDVFSTRSEQNGLACVVEINLVPSTWIAKLNAFYVVRR